MITEPGKQKLLIEFFNKVGKEYFTRNDSNDQYGFSAKEQHIDLFDGVAGTHLCDLNLWDGVTQLEQGWVLFNPSINDNNKNIATITYIKAIKDDAVDAVSFHGIYIDESEKIHFREKDILELDGDIYLVKSDRLNQLLKDVYDIKRERMKEISEQRTIAGFNDLDVAEALSTSEK